MELADDRPEIEQTWRKIETISKQVIFAIRYAYGQLKI